MVVTDAGRLVWMVDGYTVSDSHPYSRNVNVQGMGSVNYIRNSVKATVDAYDGETKLYIFAPDDPIMLAYQRLFPALFHAAVGDARRTCARTPVIPRRCSGCRRRSTARTTCSIRRPSITRRICGTWRATCRRRTAARSR